MTKPKSTANRVTTSRHLEWVPISQMRVNPRAQRDLRPAWAAELASKFDPDKIQTPHVNRRHPDDDHVWIMDGQHTVEAMRLVGWGDQSVQCWVYQGLTEAQEADMYLALNTRRANSKFDNFRVAVTAGHDFECEIDRVVRAQGLRISLDKKDGCIGAVAKLEVVQKLGGSVVLGKTLRVARDAYGDAGFGGDVIHGLGLVCQRYNGELDEARAIERLGSANGGVNGLLNKAEVLRRQTGNAKAHCVAAAAVEIINRGRGGKKLPDWWKS